MRISNINTYYEYPGDSSFAQRCAEYRDLTLASPADGPFTELIRLIEARMPDRNLLLDAAQGVEDRIDGSGLLLHGIIAVLGRFPEPADAGRDLIDVEVRERLRDSVLGFRYWPDEPGGDTLCSWIESSQIAFAAAAYLAGQLFPEDRFGNTGRTGREQMNRFRPRVERWLDLRFRTGFSEWLSGQPYDESLAALLNLIEFAHDPKLVRAATMVADTVLLDVVLNHFRGVFGCTHGRTVDCRPGPGAYERMGSTIRLVAGTNRYRVGDPGASLLSVSTRYKVPAVLAAIAADAERPEVENRQRMGIRVDEADQWGLGFRSLEDGIVFLGLGACLHERTVGLTLRVLDEYRLWDHPFFAPLRRRRALIALARGLGLLRPLVRRLEKRLTSTAREEVNAYTYRTPDYMLSCAQDYRSGYGADAQHLWQATLGPDAKVFLAPPGGRDERFEVLGDAEAILPRAVQYKNVVICHVRGEPSVWFAGAAFDEIEDVPGLLCARRGSGYLALWAQRPWQQQAGDGWEPGHITVPGASAILICVCGREVTHGSFESFVRAMAGAPVEVSGRGSRERVEIDLAPHGRISLGRRGPLTVGGWQMPITSHVHGSPYPAVEGYRRYDNPYVGADFPANAVRVRCADETLALNWRDQSRSASSFL